MNCFLCFLYKSIFSHHLKCVCPITKTVFQNRHHLLQQTPEAQLDTFFGGVSSFLQVCCIHTASSALKARGAALSRATQPCINNPCRLKWSRLLSAQQPALTALLPALITTETTRTALYVISLAVVCPSTPSTSLGFHKLTWGHQQQAISHLTHLTKRDVQDAATS